MREGTVVSESFSILVVDDDRDVHEVLREILAPRHRVLSATDAAQALGLARRTDPDVVLLDLNLGSGPDGFAVLDDLLGRDPTLPVVILSGRSDPATVVRAMKAGASHYVGKTPRYDELEETLRLAVRERRRLFQIETHRVADLPLVGEGPLMDEVRGRIAVAARSDIPVLLLGETGTGKGLVARLIHRASAFRKGPFRKVNVAGLPETLLDSELFGHERGAFTGAERVRRGLFELASGGTLLLDEIGDLPSGSQVKLLQVLDDGSFRRLGAEGEQRSSARIIAATHQPLDKMMCDGRFRRDLFHRLAGLTLRLPSLRDQPESIPELAESFLGGSHRLTADLVAELQQRRWPGNVRELQGTLRAAAAFAGKESTLGSEHLAAALRYRETDVAAGTGEDLLSLPYSVAMERLRDSFQRRYLQEQLNRWGGNVSEVARRSGLSRSHVSSLIARLDLRRERRPEDD